MWLARHLIMPHNAIGCTSIEALCAENGAVSYIRNYDTGVENRISHTHTIRGGTQAQAAWRTWRHTRKTTLWLPVKLAIS